MQEHCTRSLKSSASVGLLSNSRAMDETGKRYGRLTVIGKVRKKRGQPRILETRKAVWFCRCDCGLNTRVLGNRLRSGSVKSCVSCKIDEDKAWESK